MRTPWGFAAALSLIAGAGASRAQEHEAPGARVDRPAIPATEDRAPVERARVESVREPPPATGRESSASANHSRLPRPTVPHRAMRPPIRIAPEPPPPPSARQVGPAHRASTIAIDRPAPLSRKPIPRDRPLPPRKDPRNPPPEPPPPDPDATR